ncbi:MAG: hypothetical protein ABSG04_09075 [Verrucomicrobiota bacterium]|jgi:hypothetical protein
MAQTTEFQPVFTHLRAILRQHAGADVGRVPSRGGPETLLFLHHAPLPSAASPPHSFSPSNNIISANTFFG